MSEEYLQRLSVFSPSYHQFWDDWLYEHSFKTVRRSKGRQGKRLADIQDESWQLVSKEPPRCTRAVIFVGNLSASCTEGSLKKFVTCRSSAVGRKIDAHNCSLHVSKEEKVSARVCVDADAMPTIMSENFWPRPIYARSWKFAKRDETDRDHDGTGEKDSATGDAGFSVTPHGKSRGFEHSSPPGMHTAKDVTHSSRNPAIATASQLSHHDWRLPSTTGRTHAYQCYPIP